MFGLDDLVKVISEHKIQSIAIPPLGCGNRGLDWGLVKKMIETKLEILNEKIAVIIFEPSSVTPIVTKRNLSKKPKLTDLRAMLLASMFQYLQLGYDITVLETQKLAYFLERFST